MRLEQLLLRIPGDEFRLRFHERLTVVSGIGVLERRALIDSVIGGLTGGNETTETTYRDATGRRVRVVCEHGVLSASYDDGTPAAPLTDLLGRSAEDIRARMVLTAADLGLHGAGHAGEPPELAEARATLTALTEELHAAYSARQTVEAMREELAGIDERIRVFEENRARRDYARMLADLERLRAEAAALRTGSTGVESDRHLLATADRARHLAGEWREASRVALELGAAFGDAERLDARSLQEAASAPDEAPEGIDELVAALEAVEAERVDLSVRLREMAASRLPQPSHPAVTELARLDQRRLWEVNRQVLAMSAALQEQSVALGGLPTEGRESALVGEIERHHNDVVEAEEQLERSRRVGVLGAGTGVAGAAALALVSPLAAAVVLVGTIVAAVWMLGRPARRLARAQALEQEALEGVGAGTYLAFHLRRVDAMIDPDAREQLELAALEHRMARSSWYDLAGDVDPEEAAELEAEVVAYAASLRDLGDAAEEIEAVRKQLVEQVEPAVEAAREALLRVCAPFGVDDPFLAAELVRHQVGMGRHARLQQRLEAAEQRETVLRLELDGLLADAGFSEGDLAARVGAFEWALTRAAERERSRSSARDLASVEAELGKLEEEARRRRRPEWATVTSAEAEEPDIEELLERRRSTAMAFEASRALVPDVDRLADRHGALERRVATLEATLGGGQSDDPGDAESARQYLVARLTQASGAGPDGDAMPVVVDEAFMRLGGDAKWELLDLLERLGEKAQTVYLTDDPYVGAWARRRAAAGGITLLEPVAEGVG